VNIPPKSVLTLFFKEIESITYGRISLGVVRRGEHVHYELDKHITMTEDGEIIIPQKEERK